PRPQQIVGVREMNVPTLMIGEVKIVLSESAGHPVRKTNERWALNIWPETRIRRRADDGAVKKTFHPDRWARSLRKSGWQHECKDRRERKQSSQPGHLSQPFA